MNSDPARAWSHEKISSAPKGFSKTNCDAMTTQYDFLLRTHVVDHRVKKKSTHLLSAVQLGQTPLIASMFGGLFILAGVTTVAFRKSLG